MVRELEVLGLQRCDAKAGGEADIGPRAVPRHAVCGFGRGEKLGSLAPAGVANVIRHAARAALNSTRMGFLP